MSLSSKLITSGAFRRGIPAAVISQRSIRQLAMPSSTVSLCVVPTRTMFYDVHYLQKAAQMTSQGGSYGNQGQKGALFDLAIWLGLVAQLFLYVSVVRPKQKKRHEEVEMSQRGHKLR